MRAAILSKGIARSFQTAQFRRVSGRRATGPARRAHRLPARHGRSALGRGCRISELTWLPPSIRRLRPCLPCLPRAQPIPREGRGFAGEHQPITPLKEERKRVLARHFPARAAADVRGVNRDRQLSGRSDHRRQHRIPRGPWNPYRRLARFVSRRAVAASTEARSGANESTRSRGQMSMANTVVLLPDSARARSQLMLWCR